MGIKLEAGMYVKTLKEVTSYDSNSFEVLGTLPVGTHCMIDRVAALLLSNGSITVAVMIVHNNVRYMFLQDSLEASKQNFEVL
jgi:hypothetical protein